MVIAQRSTGRILAGNHRYQAAKALGAESIPVQWVDVDDETALRILIADNRTTRLGQDDPDALAGLLQSLAASPSGLTGVGYDGDDLDQLLRDLNPPAPEGPVDLTPPAVPVTKAGDVWLLGPHRLLCGDARRDLPELMSDDRAHLLWTDPPYGVEYVGKTQAALTIANDDRQGLEALLIEAFAAIDASLAAGAPIYVAHPAGERIQAFLAAFVAAGWSFRQLLVWLKDSMVLGHSDYHYIHEGILYGYKPASGRRGRGGEGWYGGNAEVSVFPVDRPSRSESHPTMKPVELIARCLTNSSRAGELVLDPFAGSGSTLMACHDLGRRARLADIDPAYCDVIARRYQAHTGTVPVLESTGEPHDFTPDTPNPA